MTAKCSWVLPSRLSPPWCLWAEAPWHRAKVRTCRRRMTARSPAIAETPAQLAQTARSLGLEMSERSARRILDGQISPVPPFLSLLFKKGWAPARAADRPKRAASMDPDRLRAPVDPRGLRIAERDLTQFTTAVKAAWQQLADAYYLDGTVEPVVKVEKDGIRLYIPSVKQR